LTQDIAVLTAPTAEDFAAGVLKLSQSPTLRRQIGAQAQTFACKTYSLSDYLAKVAQVYQGLDAPTPAALEPVLDQPASVLKN
jgi:hypothetical protein